jgi:hypothetical protein
MERFLQHVDKSTTMRRSSTAEPTTWSEIFYEVFARQKVPKILEQYPWALKRCIVICARQSVTSHKTK